MVRAEVPGVVEDVFVAEGAEVAAGQTLAQLRNLPMQSRLAETKAKYVMASDRATVAEMHYGDYGNALQEQNGLAAESEQQSKEASLLKVTSPVAGTVLTPRPKDRVGSYLPEGTTLITVANTEQLRARIYVSEYDMYKVRAGAPAKLQVEGVPAVWHSVATAIAPVSQASDLTAAQESTKLKGLLAPQFYLVDLLVANEEGRLKPGMTGVARVYGKRTSIAGLGWESLRIVLGRKIW
jgi:multidrug efflux pump subunit AcrA (membrane-fusion protein)